MNKENNFHIVVVSETREDVGLVDRLLSKEKRFEYRLDHCSSVQKICDKLANEEVDLILLDLSISRDNSLQALQTIKKQDSTIPVLVLSDKEMPPELLQDALAQGAQDSLRKTETDPHRVFPLSIIYAVEKHRLREQLKHLSLKDDSTGVFNRRGFVFLAEQQISLAYRNNKGFLLFIFDVDGMRKINEEYGASAGDDALRNTTQILNSCFRGSDIVARLSGDTFAVLAIDSTMQGLPKIQTRLEETLKKFNGTAAASYFLALSYGVAEYNFSSAVYLEQLIAKAEEALYIDKFSKKRKGS